MIIHNLPQLLLLIPVMGVHKAVMANKITHPLEIGSHNKGVAEVTLVDMAEAKVAIKVAEEEEEDMAAKEVEVDMEAKVEDTKEIKVVMEVVQQEDMVEVVVDMEEV